MYFLEKSDTEFGYGKVFAGRHQSNRITLDVSLWTKIALGYTPFSLSIRQFKTGEDATNMTILGES